MKHDFEVGMRVVCVKSDGSTIEGEEGTVVAIRRYDDVIIVEFDNEFIGGHSCGGRCKDGHGRMCNPVDFDIVHETILDDEAFFKILCG